MINQVETLSLDKLEAKFELAKLRSNPSLDNLRSKAYDIFRTLGIPSIKNEEWKNTNVQPFLKHDYVLDEEQQDTTAVDIASVSKMVERHQSTMHLKKEDVYTLVIINGIISDACSQLPSSATITISTIIDAEQNVAFNRYFGTIATIDNNSFAALNTATFSKGIFIEVSNNSVLDKPLHIVHILQPTDSVWMQPRCLIVVNKNAQLEVIESTIADTRDSNVFINAVTEIAVEENALFKHYELQSDTRQVYIVKRTEAKQATNSNYSNYTFTFPGSELVRNNLTIHLEDKNLECHLYGLYLTAQKQVVDNHTEVHHKYPNGESNQLYKGILLDESRAVFNGKIFVYEDAQKTNAFQQSSNLLFSEKATVNAKPQLEIFADDVKCSHGTTIGQINKEALFYLKSRGISEASAKTMLMTAFAFDVTEKVSNEGLRNYLDDKIIHIMSEA